ncbi:CCAAT-box-binding transcription factor [Cordyceps fumosorosea ARSEF 2679]|uniref:CCAAT-box-binding transcription factor n=1 Tax=Cordyceps fumosorosea (strain ARSEF 2679) TaxID=1081104 RepID=A0A167WPB9_CORFA|nr:CCAAT-box-binding transcription factor [Cordyceps fumosorosea ARSEF 2679]OAA64045.1 CCAAT-box-binding transcription factor [Cordyceps fumosorosea ARSEF 2679]
MTKPKQKGKAPHRSGGGRGPSFNEDALEKLTSRIDQRLTENDHKRKRPPTNASPTQTAKKQRNSDAAPKTNSSKTEQEALLAEILALGGDEDDLELINGVDSDDEVVGESKAPVDKKLRDELAALSKELGFAELAPQEASENEAEEEAEAAAAAEESEDEDAEYDYNDDREEEKIPESRKMGDMTFEPRADWHAYKLAKLPPPITDDAGPFFSPIQALKQHAQSLLDKDADKYRTSVFASSSHKFLSTIMTSGTLTDKVSALTLAIQESPVHNIRAFDGLMNLASKKSRGQAIGAIGALVDLLGPGTLLPADRRLRTFQNQPGLLGTLQKHSTKFWAPNQPLPGKISEEHLISWIFEDWLKSTYFKIIQLLEGWCSDEIEYSRIKAVDFVYALLKEKPEQESNLLTLLVNKLGDREKKIASRVSYLLLQLQNSHPGMKPVIVRAVEQEILLHPTQDSRSKYYAINTLNQTILSSKEPAVAESLIRIYFELFVAMLKSGSLGIPLQNETEAQDNAEKKVETVPGKPGGRPPRKGGKPAKVAPAVPEAEAADKLVSALLTGVNRAAPFVGTNDGVMENHVDTLFKIAHSANFNTGIQALLLIQHLSLARSIATDRFYRTLYESLLDPRLVTSSKQALYLNLLLRSLKNDVDVRRVKAFAKRMLQITVLHQPPFVCGLLYVIGHLRQTFPDLSTLIEQPEESVFDDDDEDIQRPAYDGRKRNPEHSNAQRSCLWEVIPMQMHYHPSVAVFAAGIVDKTAKMQKPDLDSHSLIRFLDKFVYRNAKATDGTKGVSIMQPLRATKDSGDIWLGSRGAGATGVQVNSAAFWNKKVEDVAAEDIFFHEYFQNIGKEPKDKKKKTAEAEDAEADEEAGEDEVWKALVNAQPDIEGDGSDVDEGFDDFDEEEMASLDGSSPAMSLDDDSGDDISLEGDGDDGSDGLVEFNDEDSEEEADGKKEDNKKKSARRKMLKGLPTFASVDDYAELLAKEEDGL